MIIIFIFFNIFLLKVRGQACNNSFIDFQGNCISSCSTLQGAVNPSQFNQACICPSNVPYINPQKNGCIQNCSIANSYTNPNPLNMQCIINCSLAISGSINPNSYGLACQCLQYVSFDGTQCLTTCSNYFSINKKVCIDDCSTLVGSQNPPIKGLACMCSDPSYFVGPEGMSCAASCTKSYQHIDPQNKQCIFDCTQIIQNSQNPTNYGQKCICGGSNSYLSLDRTQCLASCPNTSTANSARICVCSINPKIYIDLTGSSCIATSSTAYINLDPIYPRFILDCSQNLNVQNPGSFNSKCKCIANSPFINFDQLNNYFCSSSCFYYQKADITDTFCVKDCTSFTNMVNPSQFGQMCQCSSSFPYLLPSKQSCNSSCGSNYKGLNPNDKNCYQSCPASFPNTINSLANSSCQCAVGYPYILEDYSSCVASCQYYNTNPYNNVCVSNCSSITNAINPQSILDQGRCNCKNTDFPYLSSSGSSCVQNCNSSYISIIGDMCDPNCNSYVSSIAPSINGQRCYCNSPQKYLSEDGKSCVASCSKYLHPNLNRLICVGDCTKYGMTNPAQLGQICSCSNLTPFLSVKKDMCISSCPTNAIQNGNVCSCDTNYLQSDNSACLATCTDYLHADSLLYQCISNCPKEILGSSNPPQTGQSCQCSSDKPFLRIDMQGGYYCDVNCPNYFIGNYCIDDCTLYTNMSNPLQIHLECECSDPTQFLNTKTRQCVNSCPNFIHVVKRKCMDSCLSIQGTQAPSSGNVCECQALNPIYDYNSDSCTNQCNGYLHPNPNIKICFSNCPNQLKRSSNPNNNSKYCQCSDSSYPFYGEKKNQEPLQCVNQCQNYQFFNLCISDCSQIQYAQNPANLAKGQCTCNVSAQFRNNNNYSCVPTCPNYISLNPKSLDCVDDCSKFQNANTPNSLGNRCLCSSSFNPYVSLDGQSCTSQCNGYLSFFNSCITDCPSNIPGSENPVFQGYQCQCATSTPYINLTKSQCVAACGSNQQVKNGACVCSGSNVQKSEDGQSCISSCPNYINPNPSIKECVSNCSVFKNFINPNQKNAKCTCPQNLPNIKSDFSQCQENCDQQQYLHVSTKYLLCVQDCPSSIPGSINPTQYQQRCICSQETPLLSADQTQCTSACSGDQFTNLNNTECIESCIQSNTISQGTKCVCKSNYLINFDYSGCVETCPQYTQNISGYCKCINGIDSSTKSCVQTSTTTSTFSINLNYKKIICLILVILFN